MQTEEKPELETIGGLKVVRLLGKGGMSEVYEAEDPRLGSRHAVKLYTYQGGDGDVRKRFEVEGRLLAKLNHPRIVRVTDFGTDETTGRPYFVMDLILDEDGEPRSLADVPEGQADEETVGRWYDDLRDGLAYIHKTGVVHRDLKLQNVLIGPDGHAVLTDFGISKIFDPDDSGRTVVDPVQTIVRMRSGKSPVMGSIGYMAPELEMGLAATPQSDWYALGVITYKLLTGTWCDARTNVATTLSTFDPAWMRIIPKLLHSNPAGRECLSYAAEREHLRAASEAEAEERYLREKGRGRFARHIARYLAAALLAAVAASFWIASNNAPSTPAFAALFEVPADAPSAIGLEVPSREQFSFAMLDALVLTQGVLEDLRNGTITADKARVELERLGDRARNDYVGLFSETPACYTPSGEREALAMLMEGAAKRLK